MNFLERIAEGHARDDSFRPYYELNQIGIPIKKRREIVEGIYGPLGVLYLRPLFFRIALKEIKEKRLPEEEAEESLRTSLCMGENSDLPDTFVNVSLRQ